MKSERVKSAGGKGGIRCRCCGGMNRRRRHRHKHAVRRLVRNIRKSDKLREIKEGEAELE